jgi:hypothetical protein
LRAAGRAAAVAYSIHLVAAVFGVVLIHGRLAAIVLIAELTGVVGLALAAHDMGTRRSTVF